MAVHSNRSNLALFLLFFVLGCINPIELEVRTDDRLLVVDGFITTEPGPHKIRLTRSSDYIGFSFQSGVNVAEENALVAIRSDQGEVFRMAHIGRGIYQTPTDFQPVIGQSYSLNIELMNGDQLVSAPQLITEAPAIENVLLRYNKLPSVDEFSFNSGVDVFVEYQDPAASRNFYLTTHTKGVYPFTSNWDLFFCGNNPFCCVPTFANPELERCFRYERDFPDTGVQVESVQDCRRSGGPQERQFNVYEDSQFNGNLITNKAVFIKDDGRRFEFSYRTQINLMSISPEAFAFFSAIQGQLSIDGDIFDPPPANVRGNMLNLTNPNQQVLGYFGAFDVSSETIYIERDLLEDFQSQFLWTTDCVNLDSSSVEKPLDWQGSSW